MQSGITFERVEVEIGTNLIIQYSPKKYMELTLQMPTFY